MLVDVPNVHMVDIDYALDLHQIVGDRRYIQILRDALHKNMDRLGDFDGGMGQYVASDRQGDDGVDEMPAEGEDQHAANNDAQRGHRVRQIVDERGTNIHTLLRHAVGEDHRRHVDRKRDPRQNDNRREQPHGQVTMRPPRRGVLSRPGRCACGSGSGCWDPCRYFSLFGGWSRPEDVAAAFTVAGGAGGTGSIDFEMNDGWSFGGAIGRRVRPNVRVEGEFAYRNTTFDHVSGSGAAAVIGQQIPLDGKTNLYSGMLNIAYDFTCFRRFTPYVGVGAGVVWVNADVVEPTTPLALNLEYSTFAYQGIVGISSCISDRVDLFGEYRIFGTDTSRIGFAGLGTSLAADLDIVTHNFFVGARIKMR